MKNSRFLLIIFFLLTIIACEDDSISTQEEHFEAVGTAIFDATGALTFSIIRGESTDTLYIENGVLTDHYIVKFYDEDSNIIDPPEDEHTKLNYSIEDDSIIEFWQHEDNQGGFEFHLRGLKIGTTILELFIEHEGHNDYRSGSIPAVVQ